MRAIGVQFVKKAVGVVSAQKLVEFSGRAPFPPATRSGGVS